MKSFLETTSNRREFVSRILPACGLTCLCFKPLSLSRQATGVPVQGASGHKFDAEVPQKFTARQLFSLQYSSLLIPFLKFCVKDLGSDKTITMLKAFANEVSVGMAKGVAQRLGKNDFAALKAFFSPSNPGYANTLTFSVAESTDKAHELKVTECLWAKTFLEAKAGDLGYAGICFGDYSFAQSFNPAIEMVRDKTLMQGDAFCNHRYLWKG